MGIISFYSIMSSFKGFHRILGGGDKSEVTELSRALLGPWAQYIAKTFSISVMLGANIAYWVLMSNFLYYSVNFLYGMYNRGFRSEFQI